MQAQLTLIDSLVGNISNSIRTTSSTSSRATRTFSGFKSVWINLHSE